MTIPIAYGIDFGTSNSSVAVAFETGNVEVIDLGGADILPSLLFLSRYGNRLAGSLAVQAFLAAGAARTRCARCDLVDWHGGVPHTSCRQVRREGFCLDSRLLSQIKSALSDEAIDGTHSWGVDFDIEDLIAVVLRTLKNTADRSVGADVRRVALGHPVRFVGAEGPRFQQTQALACARLEEGARRAGFEEVALVPESQAAIAMDAAAEGLVLCTDFGGGTFDCAVVDVQGSDLHVLSLEGVAVGGEEFDGLLFDAFVRPAIGLDGEFSMSDGQTRQLPARLRSRLRSLSGLRSLLADGEAGLSVGALAGRGNDKALRVVGELLYGGQALPFYRAIEALKIALSDQETARLDFRRPWIDLDVKVDRRAFENLIQPDIDRTRACIIAACTQAQVAPRQIEWVTTTGGSSQIPAFRRMLEQTFPTANFETQDPFTSVVRGVAEYAWEEWTHG